ncbi:hypothetical protein ACVUCS_003509 [Salmonella enterica subsp. enterica]|nr:hypothetical protein [Salmonella enterica subsp. enterica serovar Volkmarsdorf]EDW1644071.1 hypothetical protein [Salmonella enterica subsp. enterica serovar Baguida]
MATIPDQTHALLTVPFSADTDFTTLADYCDRFAESLIETDDPAQRLALCGRLAACLALLRPTLNDPVPPHLVDSLTVDILPDTSPIFAPGFDLVCEYSETLAQLLLSRTLSPLAEKIMTGLLAELVWYFAAELKAPRWIRTASGVEPIDRDAAGLYPSL